MENSSSSDQPSLAAQPAPDAYPDMDAIRAARLPKLRVPATPPSMPLENGGSYVVEVDVRGESLIYREPDRSTHVICTFGGVPCIVPRTLGNWSYSDGSFQRIVPAEKNLILERIADYCRRHHRMSALKFET